MKLFSYAAVSIVATTLLTGCATPTKMWTGKEATALQDPVYLMTVTLKNNYHPSYQPKVIVAHVEESGATTKAQRLNFVMDAESEDEKDTAKDGNRYILRMPLPKKDLVFKGLTGFSGVFPVRGTFYTPMNTTIKPTAAGYYYLGHVSATVRERQGDELRAGPVIPLLDQAVTGFSGGTFDIEITDRLEQDIPELTTRFPALKGVTVQKAIMTYNKPIASATSTKSESK
jgi:hypothetical protein